VITRRGWGADESLGDRCFNPRWGTGFRAVIVHHTVSSNSYSRSESASIVRGIHAYHTQSQGWCDIGYNFLVDRFGRVFEGRDGGIRRPVRGAHAGDYNTNTTGISLIGNFESARPTRAMKHQLVQLIAWRMGTAYHGAYGAPRVYDRKIRRISGHRDVMSTACPGRYVYSWLPALRKRVATRLGNYQSAIERIWLRKGGRGGSYGDVIMGERGQRKGRITIFRRGRIYAKDGVFPLRRNPVTRKYVDVGEVHSSMGFPKSHVHNVKRRGTFAVFRHGRIYWSRPTGAKVLHSSPILRRYRTVGGANSRLGFPRTRVIQTRTGSTARFQDGRITFYKRSGKTRVSYS
ncbi:MAG: N-acetylmuramoyl-L-alanine amidase, partial [Stackebrandtia sp.]